MRVLFCESCGTPLDAPWQAIVLVCPGCGVQNAPGRLGVDAIPSSTPNDGRPRLNVAGRTYVLDGRLARGDSADVYAGRWVMRLGERVVVKVQHNEADADLLRDEFAVLSRLAAAREPGAPHFASRLPPPIAAATLPVRGRERRVSVYGWRSGLHRTLELARRTRGQGLDPHVLVWVLKRTLEVLAWAHRQGLAHGAVIPPHVLVHPREHASMLVGWTLAGAHGARRRGVSRAWRGAFAGDRLGPADDVRMAAWTTLWAAGATSPREPGTLPPPLSQLVIDAASGRHDEAWALRGALDAAADAALGPPAYHPLDA